MKKKTLVVWILSLVLSSSIYAHGDCGETKLHSYMIGIKDELKLMSTDVKLGNNESAIHRVHTLISFFKQARNTVPHKLTDESLKEEELAEQKLKYIKLIDETIDVFNNLVVALESEDSTEVKKIFGQIIKQRNIGHRAFKGYC